MKKCSECKIDFYCSAGQNSNCWCNEYPQLLSPDPAKECLCPSCLRTSISTTIENYIFDFKEGKIKNNDAVKYAGKKLQPDWDYYIENGNYVFTSWYLLKRGYCCGNGCRHCPYPKK